MLLVFKVLVLLDLHQSNHRIGHRDKVARETKLDFIVVTILIALDIFDI